MDIAFYGSSLLSSYWNGAATYYRGLLRAVAARGHAVTFYEPDVYDRGRHRDIDPPDWCEVVVYEGTPEAMREAAARAAAADVVVKASGVGFEDDRLLEAVMEAARPDALRLYWDVDAPATLAELRTDPRHPLRRMLPALDAVLTYGGGDPVAEEYMALGARWCGPVYNALDPDEHRPEEPEPEWEADLGFLGNRLPDREARVGSFFLEPARRLPERRFLLGGSGWDAAALPANVQALGHVPTARHNAFNASATAVLNINRDSMAETGFSPPTRVFEAAGAAACLLSDVWTGIELFLTPGEEVLLVRDGDDVVAALAELDRDRAREIGLAARARVLKEHTYEQRAVQVDAILDALRERRAEQAA
jgi:spore maturation protein CgeB